MEVARARKENLEEKTYKDVETKNKFSGNSDQGKKLFGQIKGQQEISSSTVQPNNPQQAPYLTPNGDAIIDNERYGC